MFRVRTVTLASTSILQFKNMKIPVPKELVSATLEDLVQEVQGLLVGRPKAPTIQMCTHANYNTPSITNTTNITIINDHRKHTHTHTQGATRLKHALIQCTNSTHKCRCGMSESSKSIRSFVMFVCLQDFIVTSLVVFLFLFLQPLIPIRIRVWHQRLALNCGCFMCLNAKRAAVDSVFLTLSKSMRDMRADWKS